MNTIQNYSCATEAHQTEFLHFKLVKLDPTLPRKLAAGYSKKLRLWGRNHAFKKTKNDLEKLGSGNKLVELVGTVRRLFLTFLGISHLCK